MLLLTRMPHPTVYTSLLVCRQMNLENKTCDQEGQACSVCLAQLFPHGARRAKNT